MPQFGNEGLTTGSSDVEYVRQGGSDGEGIQPVIVVDW